MNLAWSADEQPIERRPVVPGAEKSQSGLVYYVSETAMYMLEAGQSSLCRLLHRDMTVECFTVATTTRLPYGFVRAKPLRHLNQSSPNSQRDRPVAYRF